MENTMDWDLIRWKLEEGEYQGVAEELLDGDDFRCSHEHVDALRSALHARNLDVVWEDGRAYVLTPAAAANLGPAGAADGCDPLPELLTPVPVAVPENWEGEVTRPYKIGGR